MVQGNQPQKSLKRTPILRLCRSFVLHVFWRQLLCCKWHLGLRCQWLVHGGMQELLHGMHCTVMFKDRMLGTHTHLKSKMYFTHHLTSEKTRNAATP